MMIAATRPVQRPPDGKLLVIDEADRFVHTRRAELADFLQPGDLVVANDAATLPGSLHGVHQRTGLPIEVRLAGRRSLSASDVHLFSAVVFGAGDYHTRTEHRPPPPALRAGDRLTLGPLTATIVNLLGHPRFVTLDFDGDADAIWAGFAEHGRPIQYAHVDSPLALWDVWTPVAGAPAAFEPPSAGFALDWHLLSELRRRRVAFATITHAAGVSSTGDEALDALLPFDEPYVIPVAAVRAIDEARARGGAVVAVGTTVVRALEHAVDESGVVMPGPGVATQKITAETRLKVVDALLSGVHEPGTSHYELVRAFVSGDVLNRATAEMSTRGYRTHEFGDSVLVRSWRRAYGLNVSATSSRSAVI
jgi:S-adenosylmethionine:tRNA ribosyltransferase-isomerase